MLCVDTESFALQDVRLLSFGYLDLELIPWAIKGKRPNMGQSEPKPATSNSST